MDDRMSAVIRLGLTRGSIMLVIFGLHCGPVKADTLEGALAQAYRVNPDLDAQRAALRALDEDVPQALSGYRPKANIGVTGGASQANGSLTGQQINYSTLPTTAGITVSQNIFDGFTTLNRTRRAQDIIINGRNLLSNTEMDIMFLVVLSYMNLLRDSAINDLQQNNVEVIQQQLDQTRIRYSEGQVTGTDVSQAEARLAVAQSQFSLIQSTIGATTASYRQVVGTEPHNLAPARPLDHLVPTTLAEAVSIGLREHPRIIAALHAVDAAESQVKVNEGKLYPQLSASATLQQNHDLPPLSNSPRPNSDSTNAIILGHLTIPIYEGGEVYSEIRQAKEVVAQRRIEAEAIRDRVRASIIGSWGALTASKTNILASEAAVKANEAALRGVREEARIGQRTTLDVLNAQQELLSARVGLIVAQRDRVVLSYQLVQSIGHLTINLLQPSSQRYSPKVHYDQIKDLWYGVRTPDGR
jgi:outer membrane protein